MKDIDVGTLHSCVVSATCNMNVKAYQTSRSVLPMFPERDPCHLLLIRTHHLSVNFHFLEPASGTEQSSGQTVLDGRMVAQLHLLHPTARRSSILAAVCTTV